MIDIRRILCPVDFSDASRHALEHATAIAGWYDARLLVLHVWTPPIPVVPPLLFAEPDHLELPTEAGREEVLARLREWTADAQRAGRLVDVDLVTGNPAARIIEWAASYEADLVVMGTHGRGGFERLLLGSVAERVLHRAACPVLTIPPPAASTSRLPFKRLLCPVDLSGPSLAALRFAVSLAKESAARLTILNVIEWPGDDLRVDHDHSAPFRLKREEEVRRRIEGLISDDVRTWCDLDVQIVYGKPYREIVAIAQREAVDLIVMGVHGHGPIDQLMFGSTTNQVLRHAATPVVSLRG